MGEHDGVQQRIVLTGATGFIGGHLQRELLEHGHQLSAIVRPASHHRARIRPEVACCEVDFDDAAGLAQVLREADLVVYCAGAVRGARRRDFEAANVTGVNALAAAACAAMTRPRMLLISSLAASRPQLSDYAASKHAGEQALEQHAGLDWVIIRPPAVYGPGDREMRPLLVSIRRGLAFMVGPRDQRLALLYVADLARAVQAIVQHYPACSGRIFEADDGTAGGYSWSDIITAARGRGPVLRVAVPRPVLALLGRVNRGLALCFGYAPMLTPGKVRELSEPSWLCNNHPLTQATGWSPRTALRAGLHATFSADPA